jgi:hypothetical protein
MKRAVPAPPSFFRQRLREEGQNETRVVCCDALWSRLAHRVIRGNAAIGRFSNRPFWVKRFQTIHHRSIDVARGLALLFGIGT